MNTQELPLFVTWIGSAGFLFRYGDFCFATNPFLSRSDLSYPQRLRPEELRKVTEIFIGHGHFDHVQDLPAICKNNFAPVHASPINLARLLLRRVTLERLRNADRLRKTTVGPIKVTAFRSSHIHFDRELIRDTLKRCRRTGHLLDLAAKVIQYGRGGVRSYLFEVGRKTILFLSSAGCTDQELQLGKAR